MTRIRYRLTPLPGGGNALRTINGSIIANVTDAPNSTYPAVSHKCTDEVNRRSSDNPLTIIHESRNWIPLNGVRDQGPGSIRKYTEYYPTWAKTSIAHEDMSALIPSVGAVALATIARSNPSRPYISVPNFLFELKDLPGMIRDLGRLRIQGRNILNSGPQRIHPKLAANHYLSYTMGWAPLISDLRKLLSFQSQVDKKMRELENLYNNGGIQRRVRLPDWKASKTLSNSSVTIESQLGILFHAKQEKVTTIERWGTVRWSPSSRPLGTYSRLKLQQLARDLTFGMKGISAKQVWDAIPWTWLVGWFTNVDDFLQAHDNRIPLTHSLPCVMTRTSTRDEYIRFPGEHPEFTGGQGVTLLETKSRVISAGSLSASIPFLTGRQFSILGALAIQRKR
jgi:hypothetical protein